MKNFIKSLLKNLGRIALVILVLIIFTLAGFTFMSSFKETKSPKTSAPQTGKFIKTAGGDIRPTW